MYNFAEPHYFDTFIYTVPAPTLDNNFNAAPAPYCKACGSFLKKKET
jgi:hypothetical protein